MAGLLNDLGSALGEVRETLTGGFGLEREVTKPDDEVTFEARGRLASIAEAVAMLASARASEDMIDKVDRAARANAAANMVALTTEPERLSEAEIQQLETEVITAAEQHKPAGLVATTDDIYNEDGTINEDRARARTVAAASELETIDA